MSISHVCSFSIVCFCRCEKLTKINILHVAINYIRALESILDTGDAGVQIYGTSVVQSPYLPLPPEPEMPPEKVTNKDPPKPNTSNIVHIQQPQQKLQRTKNPSSSSSVDSNDSGYSGCNSNSGGTDSAGVPMEEEDSSPEEACPDWTELTSTLELFPSSRSSNLDTLLSSTTVEIAPKAVLQARDLNRSLSGISDFEPISDLNSSFLEFPEEDPFQLVVF